ncbi:MAG: DUF4433 domain-containing protein [Microbacterium sp.]|nr:DUF4433 domain-containing protein [Microbacterium sp.]MBA4346677.1 DUF4433 domain-containing protein [Microbacterium sp.]
MAGSLTEECIHGFEPGMCASCFPPAAPAAPAPVRRAPRQAARSLRSPAAGATGKAAEVRPPNLPQRIFHVTHMSNLPLILEAGRLLPPSEAAPALRLSSDLTRELRGSAPVPGDGSPDDDGIERSAFDCVAFSLSPQATWWLEVQEGAAGPTWSEAAKAASTVDFVVLGVDIAAVSNTVVVTDGDAAAPATRLGIGLEGRQRMLARAASSPESLQAAEALVPGPVSLATVALVAVANDRRRDEVRDLLKSAGVTAKVAVYPPWFVPKVDD